MAKHYCYSCKGSGTDSFLGGKCVICDGVGIDTDYTDVPICPYCAEEISTEELYENCTRYCDACEKEVEIEIEYTPSYTTFKRE